MPRTAKARIFRSTQTAPNSGTVRDLTTAFGAAANTATQAQYALGGTVTWRRFNPNSATATAQDPGGVTTASGQGWRDTVAENVDDQVRYAAGTWTVRVRIGKSGQTIAADIIVRVVAIVYRVTSAGVHISEIGRVTMADTTISTSTVSISGSFTTGASVTFNADDKIQAEIYVTPITAGLPAAPAAAVNVLFTVDETSANSGASFTAQPTYDILYARSLTDAAAAADTVTRAVTAVRTRTESAPAADTVTRAASFPRTVTESAPATDMVTRRTTQIRTTTESAPATETVTRAATVARTLTESAPATDSVTRRTTQSRGQTDAAPASDAVTRRTTQARTRTESAPAVDSVTRSATASRSLTDSAPAVDAASRAIVYSRTHTESAPATDAVLRTVAFVRTRTESAPATDSVSRALVLARSMSESAPAADSVSRLITFGRKVTEEIGTTVVDPVDTPGKVVSGTIKDANGNVVEGATVKLFRQGDDRVVRTQFSAADGTYSFERDIFDTREYYVVAYKTGVPGIHGVSDRDLLPV